MPATARPALLDRPLPGLPGTRPRRQAALDELATAGWPSQRQERWRYTNLSSLAAPDFDLTPSPPGAPEIAAATTLLAGIAAAPDRRLVLIDGHLVPGLGMPASAGIAVAQIEDNAAEPRISATEHPLAAVNTAFGQTGLQLRVARDTPAAEPLHIVCIASQRPKLAPQLRFVIEAAEQANLVVVQHFLAVPGASGWLNVVTQIHQAARSRVELYRLQNSGPNAAHTSLLTANLAADAELRLGYFDIGGQLVRNDVDVNLTERGAQTELFGLLLVPTSHHIDDHLRVDHIAADTRSEQAFRGIVGRRGRGVFNGKVIVRPNAQRIDARQTNDNLLLGEQAEIDTKPELEIYADDVKCSHGTTVGELDTEQLFYLRARGIDDVVAREMLTSAFAETMLERVRAPDVREHFAGKTKAALSALAEQSR
jgi:Fe-S cluster assembly protein SufD